MESAIFNGIFDVMNSSSSPLWQVLLAGVLFVSTVFSGLIYLWSKTFKTINSMLSDLKNTPPKDYGPQVFGEANIMKLMKDIRCKVKSDRVLIIQYHNGEKSIANNPFLKLTCTHEIMGDMAVSVQRKITSILANACSSWNIKLFAGSDVLVPDINEMKRTPELRGMMEFTKAQGVDSLYAFPLRTALGKTYGMGVLHYTHGLHDLDEDSINWCHDRFSAVGTLLAGAEV
jgi:hypothetical protein